MEFNCPNCKKLYSVPDSAIGARGRDVRCAKCAHEWFQENTLPKKDKFTSLNTLFDDEDDEDEYPSFSDSQIPPRQDEEDDEDFIEEKPLKKADNFSFKSKLSEDIPEGVKPKSEENQGKKKKAKKPKTPRPPVPLQALITGYAMALVLFGVVIVSGFIFKKEIVTSWPPAAAIYKLAGMPVMLEGENLVMENLSASVLKDGQGNNILVIEGRVINLTNEPITVPKMRAVMRSTNGEDGAGWIIDAPVGQVAPGESFVFKSDYPNMPRGVGSVNLTFVPTISG